MNNAQIILFDGVCNFCNFWVNFILDHDSGKKFLFCALQSKEGQSFLDKFNLPKTEFDTFILIDENSYLTKSDAAIHIAKQLDGWPKLFVFVKYFPRALRDYFYDIIAKNRYKFFGKKEYCRIPSDEEKSRFLS